MSRLRPGARDVLERRFLALAAVAALEREDLLAMAAMTARERTDEMLRLQGQIDDRETREADEARGSRSLSAALDQVAASGVADALRAQHGLDEDFAAELAGEKSESVDWRARCLRVTAFSLSTLRAISAPAEARPKLVALEARIVLGDAGVSMRAVAQACGLSVERVSQRTEALRLRFNFQKNQHNKPAAACASYSASAARKKGARAA